MRVAINGAGIAGTTLAYWLLRHGHEPVLIEQAPRLRAGGYVIDFWGVGYDVAERMGLIPALRGVGYPVGEWRLVGSSGRRRGGFSAGVIGRLAGGRFISLRRSDLAAAIYAAIEGEVEVIFDDSVAAIEEKDGCVGVTFGHHPPRDFDLLVGADGLHSRVRELAFGPESRFEVPLGYRVAAFEAAGYRPRDELVYISHTAPGRQVSRFSMRDDRTLFLLVYRDEAPGDPLPATDRDRRAILRRVFGGMGWETPAILEAMGGASDIYFDRVSQVRMARWAEGRVALAGDAAGCVSLLAGEGSGIAMAGAYVLAGELAKSGGDLGAAFAGYEGRMMPFVRAKQQAAEGFASSFVPRSEFRIALRDLATRLMAIPLLADLFVGRGLRDDIRLPDYEGPGGE